MNVIKIIALDFKKDNKSVTPYNIDEGFTLNFPPWIGTLPNLS